MKRFSLLAAVWWSLTWAIGVGLGVAFGAWLTVVGAEALPGETALDTTELIVLPATAAVVVFVVSLFSRCAAALFRRLFLSHPADE